MSDKNTDKFIQNRIKSNKSRKDKQDPDQYKKQAKAASKASKAQQQQVTNEAMQWFFNKVRIASGQEPANRNAYATINDLHSGGLVAYSYFPKHHATLPYYDTFPLILPFELYDDGWLGLNLHYLPPQVRGIIFDDIVKANSRGAKGLFVNYQWVKAYQKHRIINHGIKRYLNTQIVSPLVSIDRDEWKNAVLMPTQSFVKKPDTFVWQDFK